MYTDLTIVAPSSAPAGSEVNVLLQVKNIDPLAVHYIATSCAAPSGEGIINEEEWIDPGVTRDYPGFFIMPEQDTTIYASTWRWVYDRWVVDKTRSKIVTLQNIPAPGFSGFAISDYSKA